MWGGPPLRPAPVSPRRRRALGAKSRGNWNIGWDNGKDASDYQKGGRTRISYGEEGGRRTSGVVVMESHASDGSRLDKPMSRVYIENIKSRKHMDSEKIGREPKPGDYGSGKSMKGYV